MAASTVAKASNEALEVMLSQEYGTEGVLDAWVSLARHKVSKFHVHDVYTWYVMFYSVADGCARTPTAYCIWHVKVVEKRVPRDHVIMSK